MNSSDTIVAISSAVGAGARMIVRVSGGKAHRIAVALGAEGAKVGGSAFRARIWPGVLAWVYWFVGPRSYTGEDLVEFHIPGNAVLARMLLEEIVRRGARQAEAGEFTARAYFNGRMDLTQAESVAATISAHSEREMRAARQLLGGELARRLGPVMESVAEALALVEVGIDFSEEEVTFLSAEQVRERCEIARQSLDGILNESSRFERLSHEPRMVLVGAPNAGKSTLLNALAGAERAVVSAVAGTTRDAIWAEVRLARGMVRVVDVAGVEEGSGFRVQGSGNADSALESIEVQMHEQAMKAVVGADIVVWVEECLSAGERMELGRGVDLVVRTKVDLAGDEEGKGRGTEEAEMRVRQFQPEDMPTPALANWREGGRHRAGEGMAPFLNSLIGSDKNVRPTDSGETLLVSARTGAGMELLRARLDRLAFGTEAGVGLALNARHVAAIDEGRQTLLRAAEAVDAGAEVVAMELREVLDALGSVLGRISPDELLGRVFSRFCIGK